MTAIPTDRNSIKLSSYEASTQAANWRYSIEQLVHIRTSLNKAAVAVIRNTFESDEVAVLTADVVLYNIKLKQP